MKYSPNESRLLALIPTDGSKTTTEKLAKAFYHGEKNIPYNGRQIISNLCRALEAKTKQTRGAAKVMRGKRNGPHPIEVWIKK